MRKLMIAAGLAAALLSPAAGQAAGGGGHFEAQAWSFSDPIFGRYDIAAIQRGFQVYRVVCAGCHSLRYVAYRNLGALGYSEDEIKAIAADYGVIDGPDEYGDMFERPGIPADRFVSPYPNDAAATFANNGALPPDLSLITKARAGGADYVYGFLTGFHEAPEGVEVPLGLTYNEAFGGGVAMPDMIYDDVVAYDDGTAATDAQVAWDVTNFLMWAGDPYLAERRTEGLVVILILIFLAGIAYAVKRKVWADAH